jgi:hypothetical protein
MTGCAAGPSDARVPTISPVATAKPAASTVTPPSTPAVAAQPLTGASTDPADQPPGGSAVAHLRAVRSAAQDGYDRVVFAFDDALPGYHAEYAERPITQDGSGDAVDVHGAAVITIQMTRASGVDLSQPSAPVVYTGPVRLRPSTPVVAELVRTGDFEGTLSWAIGVRRRAAFRVTTLMDPPRIIVDVRAP